MSVPTEPGWYWWRNRAERGHAAYHNWRAVQVYAGNPMYIQVWTTGTAWYVTDPTHEWGPRIPGPEQLEAMRELAAKDAWCHIALPDGTTLIFCPYCHRQAIVGKSSPLPIGSLLHKPTCPCLRSQGGGKE